MLLVPLEFYDAESKRMMKLDYMPGSKTVWLFYRHPDGQWVTLREPTDDDIGALEAAPLTPGLRAGRVRDMKERKAFHDDLQPRIQPGTGSR